MALTDRAKIMTDYAKRWKCVLRLASARTLKTLFGYLETIGVSPRDVADPVSIALVKGCAASERVPARLTIDIMERCAFRLDDPLFGLKYAQALDPKSFGPISLFWRYAPTLRYNNRFSARILHTHHEGVVVALTEGDHDAAFVYRTDPELHHDARQFVEANLSFGLRICRWIVGAGWSPLRVAFAHHPACEPARYGEILNAPVSFEAPEDAIFVRHADLDRKSTGHDAELLDFVERSLIASAEEEPLGFRQRLERTIDDLLAMGNPRLGAAAAALGISERTLQRRLGSDGASFQKILGERRCRIIEANQLSKKRPRLSQLAERTGYSDASAVSRFIRTQSAHRGRSGDILE
jgi:AraC-like DNA-binding protein